MTERAYVTQKTQIGTETTPGTLVPAQRRLQAMTFEVENQVTAQEFTPVGSKYTTVVAEQQEWVQAALRGYPSFGDMAYVLSSIISASNPAPTQYLDSATPTGAYHWIFDSSSVAEDNPKTFTVEMGDPVRAQAFSYFIIRELTMRINRRSLEVGGQGIAQRLNDGVTLTAPRTDAAAGTTNAGSTVTDAACVAGDLGKAVTGPNIPAGAVISAVTPGTSFSIAPMTATATGAGLSIQVGAITDVELVPLLTPNFDVFVDPTFGALGTTRLGRVFDLNLTFNGRYGPIWPIRSDLTSWAAHVETKPSLRIVMQLEADANGMSYLNTLRTGSTVFSRIRCTGPTIYNAGVYAGSPLTYLFTFDVALQVRGMGRLSDQEGVYGVEFQYEGVANSGWGKAFHAELVNKTSAL